MPDADKPLLRADSEGLCVLTLNRPDQLNALNTAIFQELEAHAADLEKKEATIGCIVIRANGRFVLRRRRSEGHAAAGAAGPQLQGQGAGKAGGASQPIICGGATATASPAAWSSPGLRFSYSPPNPRNSRTRTASGHGGPAGAWPRACRAASASRKPRKWA